MSIGRVLGNGTAKGGVLSCQQQCSLRWPEAVLTMCIAVPHRRKCWCRCWSLRWNVVTMETKNGEIALVSIVHKITNLITSMDFIQSDAVSDTVKAAKYRISSSRKTMRKSRTKTVMWQTVAGKCAEAYLRMRFTFKNKKYDKGKAVLPCGLWRRKRSGAVEAACHHGHCLCRWLWIRILI